MYILITLLWNGTTYTLNTIDFMHLEKQYANHPLKEKNLFNGEV